MSTTLEEKKEILHFIHSFSEVAKKEKWTSHYDTDNDSLAIRMPKLSRDARKKYFNDEFAFYINKQNKVEGVFIEYFVSNFVSHHKDFKKVIKEMEKDIKKTKENDKAIMELEKGDLKKIVPELESVIINSLIPDKKFNCV